MSKTTQNEAANGSETMTDRETIKAGTVLELQQNNTMKDSARTVSIAVDIDDRTLMVRFKGHGTKSYTLRFDENGNLHTMSTGNNISYTATVKK